MMAKATESVTPACILVLQGGGAMGAYHIGAMEALHELDFEPDWVCGISIGAINGAIIAGNPPEHRLAKLEQFWNMISRPQLLPVFKSERLWHWQHELSFIEALTIGQPGFFSPRAISPYFASPGPGATSFYDTMPLYETLRQVVDFKHLNSQGVRLSVGATDVESGELHFFDSHKMQGQFGPEHVVASSSLPPGFPATKIGGRHYWDGGCVSNSPLEALLDETTAGNAVIFVIDLWHAAGPAPETMEAVSWRMKQIRYDSAPHSMIVAARLKLREARRLLANKTNKPIDLCLDIVHIHYQPETHDISSSDAEFSRGSIAARRASGLADMRKVLDSRPWVQPQAPQHLGCRIHNLTPNGVVTVEID